MAAIDHYATFGIPPSARFSLHQKDELAVWERFNSVTGKNELGFRSLRDFPPPLIALALHTHARDFGVKNLKFKCLKKSIADRLLGIGTYRSGEATQFMVMRDAPSLPSAPEAKFSPVSARDAADIEEVVNGSLVKTPHARLCKSWIIEDMFKPNGFNIMLQVGDSKAGFGCAIHDKKHGEIHYVCVLPQYQNRGFGKAIMNALLAELATQPHPLLTLNVEPGNAKAIHIYGKYGFRWDGDIYFNVYGR